MSKPLKESIKLRIILSVICTVLLLSPVWWYTTSIFQNPLPGEEISSLPETITPAFKLNIYTTSAKEERFPGKIPLEYHHIHLSFRRYNSSAFEQLFSARQLAALDESSHELLPSNEFSIYYFIGEKIEIVIGNHRRFYIGITSLDGLYPSIHDIIRLLSIENQKENRVKFAPSPVFDLEFNLIHMDPSSGNIRWNVQDSIKGNYPRRTNV
jgi:hypothetical protein